MSRNFLLALATVGAMAGFSLPLAQPVTAQVAEGGGSALFEQQEGIEPLTRGPLHEAFAEPITAEADAALVVSKEPPAPIDEVAPEYRPTGEETVWIPGYWGWDDDRDDFIWISGVYRVPPPGQRWVPGYWQQADRGWQWVPGFWIGANVEQLTYQDPPPASLEEGPSSPAPGDDYFYVAGYWNYVDNGYRWQPGYWYPSYSNYMWIPPRYIYTPRGCIFAGGHWDWRFGMRGQCFAPVYINRSFYGRPGFSYRPMIALNTNLLFSNLFVRPNYNHYFFGDYYGNQYARRNIMPVYAYHTRRGGYDPMMSFYSAFYRRQGEDFIQSQRDWHDRKVRDQQYRPARSWADLVQRSGRQGDNVAARQNLIAEPLARLAEARDADTKFVKIDDRQRDQLNKHARELREFQKERGQIERVAQGDATPGRRPGTPRDPNAKVETRGEFKLPPALEGRVTARVNPDDPNARPALEGRPGRDVPPPAQPDGRNVREDLRRLPGDVTRPRGDVPRSDVPRPDVPRNRPDVPRGDVPRTDTPRPDVPGPRPDVPRTDVPRERPDVPRTRPDVPRNRPDVPRADVPRAEVPRTDTPRPDAPRNLPDVPRERPNTPRTDAPRVDIPRGDVPRSDAPRTLPDVPRERPNVPRADAPRTGPLGGDAPRTRPDVPRERPNTPRADVPRERPATPRVETRRPEVPAVRPETPRARPETPRVRPETPRAERPQPPARNANPPAARPERQPRAERPQAPARPQGQPGNRGGNDKKGKRD